MSQTVLYSNKLAQSQINAARTLLVTGLHDIKCLVLLRLDVDAELIISLALVGILECSLCPILNLSNIVLIAAELQE